MKEIDRKRVSSKDQRKVSAKPNKQDPRAQNRKDGKAQKAKATDRASLANTEITTLVSDTNTSNTDSSEVYEDVFVDYMDDSSRTSEASLHPESDKMVDKEKKDKINGFSTDLDNEPKVLTDEASDSDTVNESVSSQGDSAAADNEKFERAKSKTKSNSIPLKPSRTTAEKPEKATETPKLGDKNMCSNFKDVESISENASEISEVNGQPLEAAKEDDVLDQNLHGQDFALTETKTVNPEDGNELQDDESLCQKVMEMESRIEELEEELREVAALEIALYSVVPEHGSSAHKLHTPARRLCRLYIHACKHWSSNKRATIAKNTVSGLVLIAKSCGNDVPRLSFWLSNSVVLREIICETFGISCQENFSSKLMESNRSRNVDGSRGMPCQGKKSPGSNKSNKQGVMEGLSDWQETRTFTAALVKIESWIFSRIVESIWWQTLTPNMQSLSNDSIKSKLPGRILGPSLGDVQHGSFCINLWINAFQDALRRLCPVREEGHECGCLPVLARKVMEQCLARLDVAMFNAILRESVHEIPTDPVSDPIVDPRVLPIPAGDLSFGSGAQLKNCVGNWSRWLNKMFGVGSTNREKDDLNRIEDDDSPGGDEMNCFVLLSSLSDLLMLPKDMLMDRSVRMEVCPQISLPLVKRILCNFTPDEFCPESVPGAVLEAVNAECIIERHISRQSDQSFPYSAAPVEYTPPSLADVSEKVAEVGGESHLSRSASTIQRKGYTSDEDLVELDCPLETILQKSPSSPLKSVNGNTKLEKTTPSNSRYELLREVWSA